MKAEIHPEYHKVLYIDSATGEEWVCRSTMTSEETREVEGENLPVVKLEISAASHPFWTGQMREVDTDGRVDRFRKRYGKKKG
jgi:large subunit ribosomal protein L31